MKTISFKSCQRAFWDTYLSNLPFVFKLVRSTLARVLSPGGGRGTGGWPQLLRASLRRLPSDRQRFPPGRPRTGTISCSRPFLLGCQRYLFLMPLIHFPVVLTRQLAHICCHQEVSIVHTAQFVCPKPTVGLILQSLPLKFQFQSIMLHS